MRLNNGANDYREDGKVVCRIHRVGFGKTDAVCKRKTDIRYYCDGAVKTLADADGDPFVGIGLVYRDEKDPITGWFKSPAEAVEEWKRLKKMKRGIRKAKSVSEKKGVSKVGRTADNRRRV